MQKFNFKLCFYIFYVNCSIKILNYICFLHTKKKKLKYKKENLLNRVKGKI